MKKINLLRNTIMATLTVLSFTSLAQDTVIPYGQMPTKIKTYIKSHFPKHSVTLSEIDKDGLSKKYEITLSDGVKLEFNSKYQIMDIDGKSKLPDSVIPAKIRQYVAANYPTNTITDWEIDGRNQQIELDNGTTLEFTKSGDFIRIDS